MTVGDRIKELRLRIGMSQVELAEKINVSKQNLYKYENNIITNIPSDKIETIAQIGHVSPSYLMGWAKMSDGDIGNAFASGNVSEIINNISALSPQEKKHFTNYLHLLEINRKKADNYVEQLLSIQEMDKALELNAAHARTDIEVTAEMKQHDDDIMNDDSEWE